MIGCRMSAKSVVRTVWTARTEAIYAPEIRNNCHFKSEGGWEVLGRGCAFRRAAGDVLVLGQWHHLLRGKAGVGIQLHWINS